MGRVFFVGGSLLDGMNTAVENVTVVVEGARITAVTSGPDLPRPEQQDTVVRLNGMTLMPGMYSCHFHAAYQDIWFPIEVDVKRPPTYLAYIASRNAKTALMAGITGAIGAGSPHDIDVSLRDAINDGVLIGPRLMACSVDMSTSGDMLDHHPYWLKVHGEGLARICDGPEEFRKAVRHFVKTGVDMIKIYTTAGQGWPGRNPPMTMSLEEQQAAVSAAHERGVRIRSHTCTKIAMMTAVQAGLDIIDHGDGIDDETIGAMAKAGTILCPSVNVVVDSMMKRRRGEPWPAEMAWVDKAFDVWCEMLPKATAAGIPILPGDDYGAFFPHGGYAKELGYFVQLGLTPREAVKCVTRNGAYAMGRLDELGTIEVGKLADLLVVDGDVLSDVRVLQDTDRIKVIMKNGEFVKNVQPGDQRSQIGRHAA